jgi:hypothetical protein
MALGYLSVQSSPVVREQLDATVIDACSHAVAVELDLVHLLRTCGRLLDRPGELGRHELRKGHVAPRPTGFDDTRHTATPNANADHLPPRLSSPVVIPFHVVSWLT